VAALVTVAIPAYHERYFGEAFASALAQRHAPLEILVSDDSPGEGIGRMVREAADPRVRYVRNAQALGFAGNFTACLRGARGDLVKFLNDDDRLLPHCVESLAAVLEANPAVRLATSRRRVIGAAGETLPDIQATQALAIISAMFIGRELGDVVLVNSANFVGEPTTAMFRRSDLVLEGDSIFRWGSHDYHCLADLSVWLRLLRTGLAYYAAEPLSEFRRHPGQEQERPGGAFECLVERLWLAREARRAGFLASALAWRAALAAVKARAELWQAAELPARVRTAVESFVRELDAEIARA
jgi:glycosyltransferase involved in cell wall biosynthesis